MIEDHGGLIFGKINKLNFVNNLIGQNIKEVLLIYFCLFNSKVYFDISMQFISKFQLFFKFFI